jgi:hypothetical protein
MSETNCDPYTGLACGDECDGKSHVTTIGGIPIRTDDSLLDGVMVAVNDDKAAGAIINIDATTERTCETRDNTKDCKGCQFNNIREDPKPCYKCARAYPVNYSDHADYYV